MGNLSKGIKAGLAAGVVYALMIGLLHTGFLSLCGAYQISFIQSEIAKMNPTTVVTSGKFLITTTTSFPSAQDVFGTDLVVLSLDWAVGALIAGVVYGAAFGVLHERLPGNTSKRKGLFMAVFVFTFGIILGLSGWEIGCSPDYYHAIPVLVNVPISAGYGYLLGMLYDAFGALEKEEKETAKQKSLEKHSNEKKAGKF